MLYLSDLAGLATLPESITESDAVRIFCKETDSIKIQDANRLLSIPSPVEFVPVNGKEDMLICLGAMLATCEGEATILSSSIPIPSRFADRVKAVKVKAKKTASRRKVAKPAPQPVEDKTSVEPPEDFMTPPEMPDERQEAQPEKDPAPKKRRRHNGSPEAGEPTKGGKPAMEETISDPQSAAMYNLLKITSGDIGFSWNTEMLMDRIISVIQEDKDDPEALKGGILSIRNGEKIWKKLEGKLEEAIKIATQ